jgi:hypothetical protein
LKAIAALGFLSLLTACSTFRAEQHRTFGDYRPVSVDEEDVPRSWGTVILDKGHVLRLESDGTMEYGLLRFDPNVGGVSRDVFYGEVKGTYSLEEDHGSQADAPRWVFSGEMDYWGLGGRRRWTGTLKDGILTLSNGESEAIFTRR